MAKSMVVGWLDEARARLRVLPPEQQAQVRRLIATLRLSPEAGGLWTVDLAGDKLFIAMAADTHVIHRVIYRVGQPNDLLLIYDILTFPWQPDEDVVPR